MVLLLFKKLELTTSLTERLVEAVVVYLLIDVYLILIHYIHMYYVLVSRLVHRTVSVM